MHLEVVEGRERAKTTLNYRMNSKIASAKYGRDFGSTKYIHFDPKYNKLDDD